MIKKRNRFYKNGKNKKPKSNIKTGRDYTYDKAYQARPEQVANRVKRNRARREAMRKGKVRLGDRKDVDHIKPLAKGGSGSMKNTRVLSQKANRSRK